jgi:hypothetical protein
MYVCMYVCVYVCMYICNKLYAMYYLFQVFLGIFIIMPYVICACKSSLWGAKAHHVLQYWHLMCDIIEMSLYIWKKIWSNPYIQGVNLHHIVKFLLQEKNWSCVWHNQKSEGKKKEKKRSTKYVTIKLPFSKS